MNAPQNLIRAAVTTALVLIAAVGPASAESRPLPEPVLECLDDCRELNHGCARACRAQMADCMSGPLLDFRICRHDCEVEFGRDTPEFETCVLECRDTILAPAREECRPLRRECIKSCSPGRCRRVCGPDGPGIDEVDLCKGECASGLTKCVRGNRAALHECLVPCRELEDVSELLACAGNCADAAADNALGCREDYADCASKCEPVTDTTLP